MSLSAMVPARRREQGCERRRAGLPPYNPAAAAAEPIAGAEETRPGRGGAASRAQPKFSPSIKGGSGGGGCSCVRGPPPPRAGSGSGSLPLRGSRAPRPEPGPAALVRLPEDDPRPGMPWPSLVPRPAAASPRRAGPGVQAGSVLVLKTRVLRGEVRGSTPPRPRGSPSTGHRTVAAQARAGRAALLTELPCLGCASPPRSSSWPRELH